MNDDSRAFRGVLIGAALSMPFWLAVFAIFVKVTG